MPKQDTTELSQLVKSGAIAIEPNDNSIDLSDNTKYEKIDTNLGILGLSSQLPAIVANTSRYGLYTVTFPSGISGELMSYINGGQGTQIIGSNGKIVSHASLYRAGLSTVASAITVMALASGQYFLTAINTKMDLISQGIDKILDFLYGDKKAELLAEISFIQRATTDYRSIMRCESQRIATIASLQSAEKIAMKDIEFYINDLDDATNRKIDDNDKMRRQTETTLQICESLQASLQLMISACILETYYSINTAKEYVDNLRTVLISYVDKCHSRMLSSVSHLKGRIDAVKASEKLFRKVTLDKKPKIEKLSEVIDSLSQNKTHEMHELINNALDSMKKPISYIITDKGEAYQRLT